MIEGHVDADYSYVEFYPGDDGAVLAFDVGIARFIDHSVQLILPRQFGDIAVRIDLGDHPPAVDPAWEAAAEFSVRTGEEPGVAGWGGAGWIPLDVPAGLDLRVRYIVLGGQIVADHAAAGDEWVGDSYLLQVWPGPVTDAVLLADTAPWSQYWTFGAQADAAALAFSRLPHDEALVAVVDDALSLRPDVAERIREGDDRFHLGVLRYVQELATAQHVAPDGPETANDDKAVARLITERARALSPA